VSAHLERMDTPPPHNYPPSGTLGSFNLANIEKQL
jgi:hypothetical protein